MSRVKWFFGALYDFLFPPLPVCPFCGTRKANESDTCAACKPEWEALKVPGKQSKPYACFVYDGVVKKAVWQYKYSRYEEMADFMAEAIADMLKTQKVTAKYVSFVPLHKSKRKRRGFDQTCMLAETLAAEMDLTPLRTLKRIKRTKTQARLTTENRKQNVNNAFICEMNTKPDKKSAIILLDDVYTTGATMGAAEAALNAAGYKKIIPVVFATSKANVL